MLTKCESKTKIFYMQKSQNNLCFVYPFFNNCWEIWAKSTKDWLMGEREDMGPRQKVKETAR